MKKICTVLLFILFAVNIMAQDALSVSAENKASGSTVGSFTLVSGNAVYLNSFEVKVKKENTPTSGGFYSFAEGVNFLTTTSEFKILDWTGKTEAGSWSTDGKKYTHTITNSNWQKAAYKIEFQLFNKSGNVGTALIADGANYSAKELTAVYTAEGCTVPKDSTKGTKWKSEAKIKIGTPTTKTTAVLTKASDSDSLLVTVKDAANKIIGKYKYSVIWAAANTFGLNISTGFSAPANGSFINPTEKFTATIDLKNDNGDILKLTETATNKVEKLNIWISGPKQAYRHITPYKEKKLVDGYTLQTVTGFDAAKNTLEITLHDSLKLTAGTYTMLVRAKRKGYGPELEKFYLKDFQVKQATVTSNPLEVMYTNCTNCHTSINKPLVKHNANDVKQCVVCHNVSLTGKELVTFGHKTHSGKGIQVCATCHTNNVGMTNVTKLACTTCHGSLPASPDHSAYTDATCNGCHSAGNLSPVTAHAKLTSIENKETIPTKTSLDQNYPNPFNPSTVIKFALSKNENVKLEVFTLIGESVGTIVNSKLSAGNYSFQWNANNLASGIYIYRLQTDSYTQARKMILMR